VIDDKKAKSEREGDRKEEGKKMVCGIWNIVDGGLGERIPARMSYK